MKRRKTPTPSLLVALLLSLFLAPVAALAEAVGSPGTGVLSGLAALPGDGSLVPQATVSETYLKKDGGMGSRNDVKQLSSSMTLLEGGWWIVDKDMTISHRLDIKGDTNLILKDGVTLTANQGISIRSASTLTIYAQSASKDTAGKLVASSDSYSALGGNPKFSGGGLVINGGVIRAEGGYKSAGIGGSDEGNITFLEVNGGFIEAYGWNKDVGGKPSIYAGAGIGGGYQGDGFPVTINGGTVYAKGGFGSAGIGGGQGNGGYGCTINGGTVTAIGGERGAGIGGGNNGRSEGVTITGGTVTAEGGERAAGIGGGYDSYADGITIAGGTVYATGGVYGAGIGGGMDGESTQIWISGGTVVAKAKSPRMGWGTGAAIGGGFGGDFSSEMIVSGGDVTAIGARGGAGIGAGSKANMTGSLKVTGGIVRAYGGASAQRDIDQNANRGAAGIGGGEEIDTNTGGEGGSVRIEGGTVIACGGGSWHCAIGHGHNDSVMGTITIADDMWTRWTNTVTLGAQQGDYTFTAPTVRDADLSRSWTDRRVYDSQNMRYVIIEPCPHPSTTGLYSDITTTEHEINFKCEYCKATEGAIRPHDFSNNHICICGHKEHAVTFYNEDGTVYKAKDYYVAGTSFARPDTPTKAGYTFAGWFEKNGDAYADKAYNFYVPVSRDLDLYAKWIEPTPATFTVTFNFTDPSVTSKTVTVVSGNQIDANDIPENPKQTGKKFLGWFEDGDTHPFDLEQPITRNVTLSDRWATLHTVTFNTQAADATKIPTQTVADGEHVSRKDIIPTRGAGESEWLFAGWCTNADGTVFYDFSKKVTSDLTLYAKWVARDTTVDYMVSFNPNGGTLASADDAMQVVKQGEKATAPENAPTREGAAFVGWKLNGEDYNWNDPVTKDITLVAAWEQWVTVSFDAAGGSAVSSQRLLSGQTASKPADPTRPGYIFEGWFFDAVDDPDPWSFDEYQILDSLTLTAHWKADTRTVTFDSAGGSEVKAQEVATGAKATRPADPTREGWRFAGWYLGNASYGFDTPVTKDITLTARWLRICTVRYDSNGGTAVKPLQVVSGSELTRPADPVREGYRFLGWVVDALDGTMPEWNFEEDVVEDDLVLHAHWLAIDHTVTFNSQGGTTIPAQTVAHGDRVSRKDIVPTRGAGVSEWLFAGWYANPECTVYYNFEKRVTADLTLYAKWVKRELPTPEPTPTPGPDTPEPGPTPGPTPEPDTPTPAEELVAVLFDSDGGSPVDPQVLRKGGQATKPEDPKRDGHSFEGWYLRDDNGSVSGDSFKFAETAIEKDTWLVAKWSLTWYTVSFDLNYEGAPEPPESQDVDYDDYVQQPPEPTRDGYLFAGWYQKDENGVLFSNPYAFDTPVEQEMTLYADWVPISESGAEIYLVVFDSLGGTDVDAQLVESGAKVTKPVDPTRQGYSFAGWFADPECTKAYDFGGAVTGDLTLYAKWEAVDIPVPAAAGTIRGTVALADGSWAVSSTNISAVAQLAPTAEERAAVEAGSDAELTLTASPLAEAPAADRDAAARLLAELGATEGSWNDLSLSFAVAGGEGRAIAQAPAAVKLKVTIPETLRKDGRSFWLVRVHGGQASAIAQGTGEVLEGESDLFSSYLIAYRDGSSPAPQPAPTPQPTTAPQQAPAAATRTLPATADAGTVGLAPIAALGTVLALAGLARRRRTR